MVCPVPLKHMQPVGHMGRNKRDLTGGGSIAKSWRTASCLPALPHGLPGHAAAGRELGWQLGTETCPCGLLCGLFDGLTDSACCKEAESCL